MSRKNRERKSAARIVDDAVGGPMSWITGEPDERPDSAGAGTATPPTFPKTDHALGELLSWAGLGRSRTRRKQGRDSR